MFPWKSTRARQAAKVAANDARDSEIRAPAIPEIREAYARVVRRELARGGIRAGSMQVQIVLVGESDRGLPAFTAMLKLETRDPREAVRALLGLPLLEDKLRRVLATHWLDDVSWFAGTWLHPSALAREPAQLRALRQTVLDHERGSESDSLWSVPATLAPGTLREDSPSAPRPTRAAA